MADRIIEYLGLYAGTIKVNWTPAEATPLVKDKYGEPPTGYFRYSSVVVMILNFYVHSHPDISYAFNCAASYTFSTKTHMSWH